MPKGNYFSAEDEKLLVGVGDDAAVVATRPDEQLVMTMDTLVSGVHFPQDTSAEDIAAGGIGHHDTSKPLTPNLHHLCDGDFFVMVHDAATGNGVLRGSVVPTSAGEALCETLVAP